MKFPLTPRPFAPVDPTPAQKAQLQLVADELIQQTIDEFEHFVYVQNRQVDLNTWKHAKTRENMSVFKAPMLQSTRTRVCSPYQATPITGGVPMLGVGSIVGNLADLMYLATTLKDSDMQIQSSYDGDEFVDGQLLCTLEHGTPDDPFRRHTIKWRVKEAPGITSTVVRCRDIVFLDCIGQAYLSCGERVGYVLYRTVEIPGCHEIDGMVRADAAACYLLRPEGLNSMEVFMRSQVDARGKTMDAVATISAANALIAIWKMPWGGQNKKLAWMLKQAVAKRSQDGAASVERMTMNQCPVCYKSVSSMRAAGPCQVCRKEVCSRCLTVRKISHVRKDGILMQKPTAFCMRCLTDASRLDSTDIIRIECIPKREYPESWTNTVDWGESSRGSSRESSPFSTMGPNEWWPLMAKWKAVSLHVETSEEWEYQQRHPDTRSRLASDPTYYGQHQPLWMQMNQLRLAAEQAYQLTKQNESAMQQMQS